MALRPSRRWLRFSLRTLLILVTVLAVFCAWLAGQWRLVQERRQACHAINNTAGLCWVWREGIDPLPFWRRWMGDKPWHCFILEEGALKMGTKRLDRFQSLLSEASIEISVPAVLPEPLHRAYGGQYVRPTKPYLVWRA